MSFLVDLPSIAGPPGNAGTDYFLMNLIGAIVVAFTLIVQHSKRSASLSTQRPTNTTPDRAVSARAHRRRLHRD